MKQIIAWFVGISIVLGLSLVNIPRQIITFLRVDGLALESVTEGNMLVVSAIAIGAGLSFGGAYIAHALATTRTGTKWGMLLLIWLMLQVFGVILLAPMLVAGIRATEIAEVLTSPFWQWIWAITAIVSGEVVSAGVMVAISGVEGETPARASGGLFDQLAQAATKRVLAEIEQPRQAPLQSPTPMTQDDLRILEELDDTDLGELEDFTDYEEPFQSVAQPAPIVTHEPTRVVARQADDVPNDGFATLQEVLTRQEPTAPRQAAPRQSTQERVAQLNAMSETTVEQVAQTFNIAPRSAQRLLAQSALAPIGNGVWARQQHPQIAAD